MSETNKSAGVDYDKLNVFKHLMVQVCEKTRHLAESKNLKVVTSVNSHAGAWDYIGMGLDWRIVETHEGLGNKAWISMMMNLLGASDPSGQQWFGGIGIDAVLMGANDNAAHGAMPAILTDEVSCGSSDFFMSPQAEALTRSIERACNMVGCSLVQGESPAYRYLMKACSPVDDAPSIGVHITGICEPKSNFIDGSCVRPGDVLIGFPSSGLHANGISPIIKASLELEHGFLSACSNGKSLGSEALIPTRSYVGLVNALACSEINVHAHWPITGDGAAKFRADKRFSFRIQSWPDFQVWPPIFKFMHRYCNMPMQEMLETFNCGIGWVTIVPRCKADKVMEIGHETVIDGEEGFYQGKVIGTVQEGRPGVYIARYDVYFPG